MNNFELLKQQIQTYLTQLPKDSTVSPQSLLTDLLNFADGLTSAGEPNHNNGWISIDDKLPPESERILICTNVDNYIDVSLYKRIGNRIMWVCLSPTEKVTHWQPLPQPPKEI